jgi:hypothetical protein
LLRNHEALGRVEIGRGEQGIDVDLERRAHLGQGAVAEGTVQGQSGEPEKRGEHHARGDQEPRVER